MSSPSTTTIPDLSMSDCGVCLETFPSHSIVAIQSSCICQSCAIEWFTNAVQNEESYLLKWGSIQFRLSDFQHILPPELIQQFKAKEKEYKTPKDERIYCSEKVGKFERLGGILVRNVRDLPNRIIQSASEVTVCGTYIARIKNVENGIEKAGKIKETCKNCHTVHCLVCGHPYAAGGHQCSGVPPAEHHDKALQGLLRGVDFQYCPSTFCKRKLQLIDGCNHVVCPCGQELCYVCGEPAAEISKHWDRECGGCPRYNHPSQPNANWDDLQDGEPEEAAFVDEDADFQLYMAHARQQQQQRRLQEQQMQANLQPAIDGEQRPINPSEHEMRHGVREQLFLQDDDLAAFQRHVEGRRNATAGLPSAPQPSGSGYGAMPPRRRYGPRDAVAGAGPPPTPFQRANMPTMRPASFEQHAPAAIQNTNSTQPQLRLNQRQRLARMAQADAAMRLQNPRPTSQFADSRTEMPMTGTYQIPTRRGHAQEVQASGRHIRIPDGGNVYQPAVFQAYPTPFQARGGGVEAAHTTTDETAEQFTLSHIPVDSPVPEPRPRIAPLSGFAAQRTMFDTNARPTPVQRPLSFPHTQRPNAGQAGSRRAVRWVRQPRPYPSNTSSSGPIREQFISTRLQHILLTLNGRIQQYGAAAALPVINQQVQQVVASLETAQELDFTERWIQERVQMLGGGVQQAQILQQTWEAATGRLLDASAGADDDVEMMNADDEGDDWFKLRAKVVG